MSATKNNPFNTLDSAIGTDDHPLDAFTMRELRRNGNRLLADLQQPILSLAWDLADSDDGSGPKGQNSFKFGAPEGTWTELVAMTVPIPPGTTEARARVRLKIANGETAYLFPSSDAQHFDPTADTSDSRLWVAVGDGTSKTHPTSGEWTVPVRANSQGLGWFTLHAWVTGYNADGAYVMEPPGVFNSLETEPYSSTTNFDKLDRWVRAYRQTSGSDIQVWQYNGSGSPTDVTSTLSSSISSTLLFAATTSGEAAYIGTSRPPYGARFNVATAGVGTHTIAFEYYNGSTWGALTEIDYDVDDFTETASSIYANVWEVPDDWTASQPHANMPERYYWRARISSTGMSSSPSLTQIWTLDEVTFGWARVGGYRDTTPKQLFYSGAGDWPNTECVALLTQSGEAWLQALHLSPQEPPGFA